MKHAWMMDFLGHFGYILVINKIKKRKRIATAWLLQSGISSFNSQLETFKIPIINFLDLAMYIHKK